MENKLTFGIKSCFKPTPKNLRRIGTSILTFSTGLATLISQSNWDADVRQNWVLWCGIIGLGAKVFSNFFGEYCQTTKK